MKDKITIVLNDIIFSLINDRDYDKNLIREGINLIDDCGFSSIEIIQLIIKIEKVFQIRIKDDDLLLDNLSNYNKLIKIIIREIGQ